MIYNDIHGYIIIILYCISIYNVLVFYLSMYVCVYRCEAHRRFSCHRQSKAQWFVASPSERGDGKQRVAGGTSPQAESQQKKIGCAYRIQECVDIFSVLLDSDSHIFPWCPFPNHEIKWFRAGPLKTPISGPGEHDARFAAVRGPDMDTRSPQETLSCFWSHFWGYCLVIDMTNIFDNINAYDNHPYYPLLSMRTIHIIIYICIYYLIIIHIIPYYPVLSIQWNPVDSFIMFHQWWIHQAEAQQPWSPRRDDRPEAVGWSIGWNWDDIIYYCSSIYIVVYIYEYVW
jgi:hypothetical protein